ncbi:hypothetical protein BOTBODRAFT_180161 [Botryobasidium botryosum FD-172 SS1]|uniref:Sacsin/Nov domain-containing protein n=1 Tax=Botryobasidium botryosum (strain FD-172 SS1) TaxID=930990 RepID=A0A067M0D0_BOTB1|nr:hypothetical protein BOTBODRAFT_180161 [Botryobasidium botryosum FD-172 SS1]
MDHTELWEGETNEPIKINQKALIDKVLARYSGEFVVFRELLQNADDANAERVKIHFKTRKYMARNKSRDATGHPELNTGEVTQWTVQNDGKGFEAADRDRLKSIADGNPNEQKIGAFGVGFYSVFSVTDTPVVTSVDPNDEKRYGMAFHWANAQLFDFNEMMTSSIGFTVFSASIEVRVDSRMTEELKRATKKNPPAHCVYQLLYLGKAAYDTDSNDQGATSIHWNIFQGIRTGLDSARIFIGHATSQTTGICGHVSARFIPTVERALIELVNETHHETIVSRWNKELLFVGGYLARAVYEHLVGIIKAQWKAPPESTLQQEFVHILRFFTFHPSTPSPAVSRLAEDAFFSCALSDYLPVVSTAGIKDARQVRLYDPAFAGFIKEHPTLPMDITEAMTVSLREKGLVRKFSFADVIQELKSRPLTPEELIECLKWWKSLDAGARDHSHRNQLLSAARFFAFSSNGKGEQLHAAGAVVRLESIRTFIDPPDKFPLDIPLPSHTFPAVADHSLDLSALGPDLGWSALTVVEWVENLTSKFTLSSLLAERNLIAYELFATQVLLFIAQVWASPPVVDQHREIVNKLKEVPCIPTQCGPKRPDEAYLKASIFPDLPVVSFPKGVALPPAMNRMLSALGVREGVKLQLVFDRMVATRDWGNSQLVKYLVQNGHTLTPAEQQRLKEASAFLKEEPNEARVQRSSFLKAAPITMQDPKHFTASQLYEPTDTLRQLDLPILDWDINNQWQANSDEANLLFELGLNRRPAIHDLLERAACSHPALSRAAFQYFMMDFSSYAPVYEVARFSEIPFVPSIRPDGSPCLAKPNEVFIDPDSSIMGFLVVDPSVRLGLAACSELQLKEQPPIEAIIARLSSQPPNDHETANRIFSYLDKRKNDFTAAEFTQLRVARIIPVRNHTESSEETVCLKAVHECYAGEPRVAFHANLFTFISGFDGASKAFLRACGIKEEPTVPEIIRKIISKPQEFYGSAGGTEGFLAELRNIARNWMQVEGFLQEDMKRSPMFLGRRLVLGTSSDEVSQDFQDTLLHPEKIVVVDDEHAYGLFSIDLYGAPQEIIVEELYFSLGSPRLSSLVREKPEFQGEILEDPMAKETRALILERLPLFLREYRSVHQQPLITVDELSQNGNFLVKTVGKLQLVKILDWPSQNLKVEKKSEASAAGFREKKGGPIQLLLARNIPKLDMYEVAHSMCKAIFYQHRASDSSLLAGILSADLDALKRRGYNVDTLLSRRQVQLANKGTSVGTQFPGVDYFAKSSPETRVSPPGVTAKRSLIHLIRKFRRSHSEVPSGTSSLGLLNSTSITHSQRMQFVDANINAAVNCKGSRVPLSSILPSQPPHINTTQEPLDGVVYCDTNNRHEGFIPAGA